MKTILGIDTGSTHVGWAVVRGKDLLDFGLHLGDAEKATINVQTIRRMREFLPRLRETITEHGVTHLCAELVPVTNMGNRDKVLGTVNLLRTAAMYEGLHYLELPANTVKKRFTGRGDAPKSLVRDFAINRYHLGTGQKRLRADVYDAIAIATVAGHAPDRDWWTPNLHEHPKGVTL